MLPATDGKLEYFNYARYFVELNSATLVSNMGLILFLMGDKLNASTRDLVINRITTRAINPVLKSLNGTGPWYDTY